MENEWVEKDYKENDRREARKAMAAGERVLISRTLDHLIAYRDTVDQDVQKWKEFLDEKDLEIKKLEGE